MPAPSAKKWPELKAAYDAYGFNTPWEEIYDLKVSPTHKYVVIAFKNEDGTLEMADFAYPGQWDVQNDGSDPITVAEWRKLVFIPDCDGYTIPGNPDYQ